MKNLKNVLGVLLLMTVMVLTLLGANAILHATHVLLAIPLTPAIMIIVFGTGFKVAEWLD
jgi:uncharacterized protein (DUF2062 family)